MMKKISFSHWFECGEYLSEDTREIEIINSNKALEAIEALPSAQPERKKGKWIPQDMNKSYGRISTAVYYYPKCSVCGWSADNTNFCPNCGADMRGEQIG